MDEIRKLREQLYAKDREIESLKNNIGKTQGKITACL